jgi:hypothetical protein
MSDGFWADAVRVREVANSMTASAEALGTAADSIASPGFGTAAAGRNYGDLGAAYLDAHSGLGRAVGVWRSSVDDIADALVAAMSAYEIQDDAGAHAIDSLR